MNNILIFLASNSCYVFIAQTRYEHQSFVILFKKDKKMNPQALKSNLYSILLFRYCATLFKGKKNVSK